MLIDTTHVKPASVEQFVSIRYWTPSLLSFTSSRPLELSYLPGQYARIALPLGDRLIWRAFSFVSAPHEKLLEFVAVIVRGGLFTTRLAEMQAGDALHVEHENYGFLTSDRFGDGEDLWMLATGTGIGPFISILRDPRVWHQFRRIVLVRGVRSEDELIYRDELLRKQADAQAGQATLTLVDCISGPRQSAASESFLSGRITTLWDAGLLEAKVGIPVTRGASRVMLCGNPQMIEDMRVRLHARSMKPCRRMTAGQFLTENYW